MNGIILVIVFLFSPSLAGGTLAQAVQRPARPVPAEGCVTAECHATIKRHRVVHGPVNVNACDACHTPVDESSHTFKLARDETELCTFCHQIDTRGMAVVHQPLKDGQCLQCHDPHGGVNTRFLRGTSTGEMCQSCHADVTADKRMVHGPVAADACGACHQAHAAPFPKLLTAEGPDLCFSCHAEMKTQLTKVAFAHQAVEEGCLHCHDAHASDFTMQTRQAPDQLCMSCHEAIKEQATGLSHQHSVVIKEQACLTCHTSHGSDLSGLMKGPMVDMCMSCHGQEVEGSGGRIVAAVSEVTDPDKIKHGPVRDGDCSGCHEVHGSDVSRLLSSAYPETFYQGFSQDKYELCFSCHDPQLVALPQARGLTGFRNGDVNLHYLHVNKEDRGRNCRACHSTHASTNELHLAETVPFGQWQMPINYRGTETGGSCAPGCHKAYEYDREQPVSY